MKPFIYKVKGLEVYISNPNRVYPYNQVAEFVTADNATIHRSNIKLMDNCFYGYSKSGDITDTLRSAGVEEVASYTPKFKVPAECLEKVYVDEAPASGCDIKGGYVIKVKGMDLYFRPSTDKANTFTTDKDEAKVYDNPKSDPIGKLERAIPTTGTPKVGSDGNRMGILAVSSKRGKKVVEELLKDENSRRCTSRFMSGFYDFTTCEMVKTTLLDILLYHPDKLLAEFSIPLDILERVRK